MVVVTLTAAFFASLLSTDLGEIFMIAVVVLLDMLPSCSDWCALLGSYTFCLRKKSCFIPNFTAADLPFGGTHITPLCFAATTKNVLAWLKKTTSSCSIRDVVAAMIKLNH